MIETEEFLIPIDLRLRFALFGLEGRTRKLLSAPEIERVFREAAEDQVSRKDDIFHHSASLRVLGRVDEDESETIQIIVRGERNQLKNFREIVENAETHVARYGKRTDFS